MDSRILAGAVSALLTLLMGLGLLGLNHPAALTLRRASYDWLFGLPGTAALQPTNVIILYLDDASHRDLNQPFNRPWDRRLHARLLDRLTADGARLVVFDIVFSDAGPDAAADQALATAIRANGRVVLASDFTSATAISTAQGAQRESALIEPYEPFRQAAAGVGFAQLHTDEDFVVREHFHGLPGEPAASLSWAAARLLDLAVARTEEARFQERWVRYYGGAESIRCLSYRLAEQMPPGYFRGQIVLIGARPTTGLARERRDEFRHPMASWYARPQFMPAAEVHATMLLNLIRGDWLSRWPPAAEWGALLLAALVFGGGLCRLHVRKATLAAALGGGGVAGLAVTGCWLEQSWFPWLIIVAGQVPCAWVCSVSYHSLDWLLARRRADRKIRQQAALLDQATDAIIVHDLQGRVAYWNRGAERLYGWTAAELGGRNLYSLICPPDSVPHRPPAGGGTDPLAEGIAREALQQVVAKGVWLGELRQVTKSGAALTVESRWTLLPADAGAPAAILVINTDVTAKRKLEAHLLQAQRIETIGLLTGGVAHDLNNVLSPITTALELLQAAPRSASETEALLLAAASTRRGTQLVRQLLEYARGRGGERKVFRLEPLLNELASTLRGSLPGSIRLRTNFAPGLFPLAGDPVQVYQVLHNLCVNARDAMPQGGELTLEAANRIVTEPVSAHGLEAKPGDYLRVRIADTGSGMTAEVQGRLFEPFFTTKEAGKGTGLGLSLSRTIVRAHGGLLELESEVGKGTAFTVSLPASDVEPADEGGSPATPIVEGNGQTILVADDDAGVRDLLKSVLLDHGYRVLTAVHGAEAQALVLDRQNDIGAAIVDLVMPVMGGPALLRALHRLRPGLPCIVISGTLEADRPALDPGDPVVALAKPLNVAVLLQTLGALLGPANPPRPGPQEPGG